MSTPVKVHVSWAEPDALVARLAAAIGSPEGHDLLLPCKAGR